MSKITRISGAVGPKVLAKADQLFNQSDRTIFSEIFQNSRRAGASRVDVLLEPYPGGTSITVLDDGDGIADFQKLVTFGDSDWSEMLDVSENAAGMGFFSLASRGVTVRSKGKVCSITRGVFIGEDAAPVLNDPDPVEEGTVLHFCSVAAAGDLASRSTLRGNANTLVNVIAEAARYFLLPVTINGELLAHGDFLQGAKAVTLWRGVRLGVFDTSTIIDCQRVSERGAMNFHGHVVKNLPCWLRGTVDQVHGASYVVHFDVFDAPDLKLVLPTRDGVIENEFIKQMGAEGQRAIFRYLASLGRHSLGFKAWAGARALGIDLPEAELWLDTWSRPDRDGCREGSTTVCVAAGEKVALSDLERPAEYILSQILTAKPDDLVLMVADSHYDGYPSYDQFPRITGFEHVLQTADGVRVINELKDTYADIVKLFNEVRLVSEIVSTALCPEMEQKDGPRRLWSGQPKVIFDEVADYFDFSYIATKNAEPAEVAEILMSALFRISDDYDAGSHDEQLEGATREGLRHTREQLRGSMEAAVGALLDHLIDHRYVFRFAEFKDIKITARAGENGFQMFDVAVSLDGHPPRTLTL